MVPQYFLVVVSGQLRVAIVEITGQNHLIAVLCVDVGFVEAVASHHVSSQDVRNGRLSDRILRTTVSRCLYFKGVMLGRSAGDAGLELFMSPVRSCLTK